MSDRRIWQQNPTAQRLFYGAAGLAFLAIALWLVMLGLLSLTINAVFLEGRTLPEVTPWLTWLVGLMLLRAGLMWGSDIITQHSANRAKGHLRGQLMNKLAALGPTYTRGERAGELVHTAVEGIEALDDYITQYQPARLLAGLVPALVFVAILILDPWTLPILLFTGPILLILLALIGGRTRELTARRFNEMSWMSAHFLDVLQGLPTLKMFGRSQEQAATVETISRHYGNSTMDVLRTAFQTSLVLEWGATAATALVAIQVSVRLMAGLLPFEIALAVLLLTPEFFLPLRQLALKYHAGTAGKAAAERIYAILDQPVPDLTGFRKPVRSLPTTFDLRFEDVYVAYDGGERPALNGFSLTITPGQTVALVGPTGAGKTTVANLLLRFVEPTQGSIRVGDLLLNEIDPAVWRAQVAWVPQHPHLFQGTIAENLRLARPEATLAELVEAAQAAQAHDFIEQLPHGYDTAVGEQGIRLSGGQRQRLAIARAFLKDAPLLILDEATSHLDAENEALIQEALARLMQKRTVLIIAHRLKLANQADVVVRLESGRVVQKETPHSLAGKNGTYQQLVVRSA
jgi:ATP-binding cassette subfamily C protein CydD